MLTRRLVVAGVGPTHPALRLPALQICKDPVKVKAEFCRVLSPVCIKLSKNFILPRHLSRSVLRACRWSFCSSHDSLESSHENHMRPQETDLHKLKARNPMR